MVGIYIANGTVARACLGFSPCRMCGRPNGAVEYTDGTYLWPQGLVHYLDDHDVRLPDEFVRHAIARLDAIETAEIDLDWWRVAMRGQS